MSDTENSSTALEYPVPGKIPMLTQTEWMVESDDMELEVGKGHSTYRRLLSRLKRKYQKQLAAFTLKLQKTQELLKQVQYELKAMTIKMKHQQAEIVELKADSLQDKMLLHRSESQVQQQLDELKALREFKAEHLAVQQQESLFTAESLSQKFTEYSVILVHIHPIVGHISIRAHDFVDFVSDSDAFIAKYLGVDKEHYLAWMEHCNKPVCTVCDASDEPNYQTIPIVSTASEFEIGVHDRCEQHREKSPASAPQENEA